MTPLEQDIYALMGVSPLVRLNREFKDPRSVVVSVKLPGEPDLDLTQELSSPAAVSNLKPETGTEPESENGESDNGRSLSRRRRRRSSATNNQ